MIFFNFPFNNFFIFVNTLVGSYENRNKQHNYIRGGDNEVYIVFSSFFQLWLINSIKLSNANSINSKNQNKEIPIVPFTDTICCIRAMMIKKFDAVIAISAMHGPWRYINFANFTKFPFNPYILASKQSCILLNVSTLTTKWAGHFILHYLPYRLSRNDSWICEGQEIKTYQK